MRTIIDKLKLMEYECMELIDEAGSKGGTVKAQNVKLKAQFISIETYQMIDFVNKKTEEEFK